MMIGSRLVDSVQSYFGMRSISLGRVGGVTRILLNGHFIFQTGALDQGFWPDGIYTAPSDAALRFDIATAKRLGYNMLRKHVKVEPDRWYYWADRLGMLVWQDMPDAPTFASDSPDSAQRAEFRTRARGHGGRSSARIRRSSPGFRSTRAGVSSTRRASPRRSSDSTRAGLSTLRVGAPTAVTRSSLPPATSATRISTSVRSRSRPIVARR